MEFAKIYDAKINKELKEYEKLQWEMYYRTLLPEHMQQFEQEYTGDPEGKEQAMKQHKAELIAKHTGRIQRLLNQKRERLTVECLGELIDHLETAQHEADQEDNEFNPEDYEELPVDDTSSCEDEAPTLASEIIADQKEENEKLRAKLVDVTDKLEDCLCSMLDSAGKACCILYNSDRRLLDTGAPTQTDLEVFYGQKEKMLTEHWIAEDYLERIKEEANKLDEIQRELDKLQEGGADGKM